MAAAPQDTAFAHRPRGVPSRRAAAVIVVGAGLSGLQAAYDVQTAGASCLVLEARDRAGGRFACGPHAGGDAFDGQRHPRVLQLAAAMGLELERHDAEGRDVVEGLGACDAAGMPELGEDDGRSLVRVRANLHELCQRVDVNRPAQLMPNYGSASAHELVVSQGGTPVVQRLADAWVRAVFGRASTDVSALFLLAHCRCAGGLRAALASARDGLRLRGGGRALCDALAARLRPGSLCLAHEVVSIDQRSGNKCVVTTRAGDVFQCTAVILSAPASQCRAVDWAPALGRHKQWLRADGAADGFVRRVAVVFDEPWWRQRGLSGRGLALDPQGPVAAVEDTSRDDGSGGRVHALTCVVAGAPGRRLWQAARDERRRGVLRHLAALFGDDDLAPPRDVVELDAETDARAPGPACPAVPAAHLRDVERDQWRPEGAVFFAGAETGHVWRGHAEGALAAGSRAAEEVVRALRPGGEAGPSARL